jgi:hypothetical protein
VQPTHQDWGEAREKGVVALPRKLLSYAMNFGLSVIPAVVGEHPALNARSSFWRCRIVVWQSLPQPLLQALNPSRTLISSQRISWRTRRGENCRCRSRGFFGLDGPSEKFGR